MSRYDMPDAISALARAARTLTDDLRDIALAYADGCVPYPCPTVTTITRHLENQ